jgi:hypothetical protein
MLALLEHCVSELGGTYVMEDTDSMAIVATERGGLVRCARRLRNSWEACIRRPSSAWRGGESCRHTASDATGAFGPVSCRPGSC